MDSTDKHSFGYGFSCPKQVWSLGLLCTEKDILHFLLSWSSLHRSSVLAPLEPVLRSNKCFRMYCCSLWGFLDIVYDEVVRHYSHGLIFQIRLKFLAQPWSQFVKESLSHQLHITPAIQQQYAFSGSCIHMSAVLQQTMKILLHIFTHWFQAIVTNLCKQHVGPSNQSLHIIGHEGQTQMAPA